MRLSVFFLFTAILAFVFGAMMFFVPSVAAQSLGMTASPDIAPVLRGMGGLIVGSGTLNFLVRKTIEGGTARLALITNVVTHALGLSADILGVTDGVLAMAKMAPVEITHLFCGIGSLIYLISLKTNIVPAQ